MSAIFISYRREDAEGQAGRLYDDLVAELGRDAVFMDVEAIRPGVDFRQSIDQSLASCGVFLALIGPRWLQVEGADGRRRLDDSADFVRVETAMALRRNIPLIPVLVQGAQAPKRDELPAELADLAFRNGVELRHTRWDDDVRRLVQEVRAHLAERVPVPPPAGRGARRWWGAAGAVAVLGGVLFVALRSGPTPPVSGQAASVPSTASTPAGTKPPTPVREDADPGDAILATLRLTATKHARGVLDAAGRPRHDYGLSIVLPPALLARVTSVHYDLIYESNPLALDGGAPPDFAAGYEGWGCYTNVDVTVAYEVAGTRRSVTKRLDMCQALVTK